MNDSICVSCGRYVPEGRMICSLCENELKGLEQLAGESSVDLYAVSVPAVCRYCLHRGNRLNCSRCSQQP